MRLSFKVACMVSALPGEHTNDAGATPFAPDDQAALQRLIRQRRSIRRYTDRPVEQPLLEALLEAATWAPSAHNRQPWRFCVVQGTMRQQLSAAMAVAWRSDLLADGVDAAWVENHVAVRAARIAGAPAVIVACLCMADMDYYPDARRAGFEHIMATQSVALACQNLLLSAHAAGLGACWVCAPLFVPEIVRTTLQLPADWEPQALLTLGWPAETRAKERAPLASRVQWR
jgi:coenzyme F420-0:L-glutamate ligase/coenzyme F420-1:gamma-L-glutamate ligase